jgi:hypothetical protein
MQLLQDMPRLGQHVFGTSSIGFCEYANSKRALDERIAIARQAAGAEPMPAWVLHDLRRQQSR